MAASVSVLAPLQFMYLAAIFLRWDEDLDAAALLYRCDCCFHVK